MLLSLSRSRGSLLYPQRGVHTDPPKRRCSTRLHSPLKVLKPTVPQINHPRLVFRSSPWPAALIAAMIPLRRHCVYRASATHLKFSSSKPGLNGGVRRCTWATSPSDTEAREDQHSRRPYSELATKCDSSASSRGHRRLRASLEGHRNGAPALKMKGRSQ